MAEATESWAVTLAVRYGDVFEEICGHLGFVDLIKLGMACRAFDEIIDPRDMMRRRGYLREEMREVDLQEHPSGDLACYYCTRMRPKNLFTHGQSRDKFASRKGRYQTAAMTRICAECAVPMRFYRHLAPVKFRGERHVLYHRCGLFASELRCCGRIAMVREDGVRIMPVICYFELRDPWNPLSSLEKMPREAMRRIARHLDHDDAINLGMVSQWMYRKVNPAEMVPIHERYRFTNKLFLRQEPCAWSEDEFGLPSGRLPSCHMLQCFVCFRIRDRKHFTINQIEMSSVDPIEAWRMRCKSCLQKLYVERDSVLLARYRSYEMCQGCFTLKDKEKDCFYCAEWRRAGIIKGPKPRRDGFRVGSFDSRREHSFLTEATIPLRKHGTTLKAGSSAWELGTAQLEHHGWL